MGGPHVPFRLRIPGKDTIDLSGIEEISYTAEGNVALEGDTLFFEWAATRKVERVSVMSVDTEVSESPIASLEVSVEAIARVHVRRAWWGLGIWGWELEFKARRLDVFDDIPGGRLGRIRLGVRRGDRAAAVALADAVNRVADAAHLS